MKKIKFRLAKRVAMGAIAATLLGASALAGAQPVYDGWLCCSLRADGKGWMPDINYTGNGLKLVPAGTPVKIVSHGRYRVELRTAAGATYWLGNDYSRDLNATQFTERYIVRQDPNALMVSWPKATRDAIATSRVHVGMTREQVIMALGYPVTSENPNLDVALWRYWLGSFEEYRVHFDGAGKVSKVSGDEGVLVRVLMP